MKSRSVFATVCLLASCSAPALPPKKIHVEPSGPVPRPLDPPVFVLQDGFEASHASISPDGRLVAECKSSGRIFVWSVGELAIVATFDAPSVRCDLIVWGPTGTTFAMSDSDMFCLWDVTRAEQVACNRLRHGTEPLWSATDAAAAMELENGDLAIVDMTTSRMRKHQGKGEVSAIGDDASTMILTELGKNVIVTDKEDPTDVEPGLASIGAGERFASFEDGNSLRIWDLQKRTRLKALSASRAIWSPRGDRLAFIDERQRLSIWDSAKDVIITQAAEAPAIEAARAFWIGDSIAAVYSKSDELFAFDVDRRSARSLGMPRFSAVWPSPDGVHVAIRALPDFSPSAVATATPGGELRLIDASTGQVGSRLSIEDWNISVGWSEAPSPVVLAWLGPVAKVFDMRASPPIERGTFPKKSDVTMPVPRGVDGSIIGKCSKGVVTWDARGGAPIFFPIGEVPGGPREPFASDDGKVVGMLAGEKMIVVTAAGKRALEIAADHGLLNRDGSLLVTWWQAKPDAMVWDVATGEKVGDVSVGQWVTHAEFQPGGDLLLIGAHGNLRNETRIYSLSKHATVGTIEGDAGAFSPDGSRIITATATTLEIRDAAAMRVVAAIRGGPADGHDYHMSPDGTKLLVRPHAAPPEYDDRYYGGALIFDLTTNRAMFSMYEAPRLEWLGPDEFVRLSGASLVRHTLGKGQQPVVEIRSGLTPHGLLAHGRAVAASDGVAAVLVRPSDGAQLWLRMVERKGKCSLYVHDEEGSFDGDPMDEVAFRVGQDLRVATVDRSPVTVESHRRPGLYAKFLKGEAIR